MAEAIKTVGELAGVCGHDGDDWQKVGISASNRLTVEAEASDGTDLKDVLDKLADILTELNTKLETADLASDTTRYINALQQQYTGSAWVRSNLLWGYNDRWAEQITDLNADAGANTLTSTAVPANYVYMLQAIRAVNVTSAITSITVYLSGGGVSPIIDVEVTPGAGTSCLWTGEICLKEDDTVGGDFAGCTAGDDIYLMVWGYKMKISM